MLRIVFLLLVLANAGYYLWSHDHLAPLGMQPSVQAEPQRLQQQIQPEALKIEPPKEATVATPGTTESAPQASAEPAAKPTPETVTAKPVEIAAEISKPEPKPAPKEAENCYQATNIDERLEDNIRRALAAQPKNQWELTSSHQNGRWMVYMGKFPDAEFLDRKRGELRLMNIDFDRVGGNLEPGLSLGRFSSEEAAQRQLSIFARQGVRSARVIQERVEQTSFSLRLPKATASFKNEVVALLGRTLEPKALRACSK